jgi:hypothetical protein
MKCTGLGLLALLLAAAARAGDKDPPDKKEAPAGERRALEKEFDDAQQKLFARVREIKTDDERAKVIQERQALIEKFAPRFLKLAETNPKGPEALDALLWVLNNAEMTASGDRAAAALVAGHLNDEKLRQHLPQLVHSQSAGIEKLLRAAATKAENADTRAVGTFVLGQYLIRWAELPGQLEGLDEANRKQIEAIYGRQFLADLRKIDPDQTRKEAEALLEEVEKKYADVKLNGRTLGEQAKPVLFEMRHLSVGKVAPEIEGEDLDGKKFKLSDYRGKVVVIDFWGNW